MFGLPENSVVSKQLPKTAIYAIWNTTPTCWVMQIAEDDAHAKLMKQIEQLEKKVRAEKQPRKKLELFERLKELKKKI